MINASSRIRFVLSLCALAGCASSVCPTIDGAQLDATADGYQAPPHDAAPDRLEQLDGAQLDAADEPEPPPLPERPDAGDRDAWGCSPCAELRRCCMIQWGPACEIIDRNFSLDWCEGRYGRFVTCSRCAPLDCAIVRARACE